MIISADFLSFQKYEDYYNTEEDINAKLNIFSVNMQMAYGGVNDVHTQIGFPSNKGTSICCVGNMYSVKIPTHKCTGIMLRQQYTHTDWISQ